MRRFDVEYMWCLSEHPLLINPVNIKKDNKDKLIQFFEQGDDKNIKNKENFWVCSIFIFKNFI